jgi:PAS domain-containing protein
MFRLTDLDGNPLAEHEFPIMMALSKRSPAHREVRYCGLDGVWRNVAVSAIPVEGQAGRFHGIFATFWEIDD